MSDEQRKRVMGRPRRIRHRLMGEPSWRREYEIAWVSVADRLQATRDLTLADAPAGMCSAYVEHMLSGDVARSQAQAMVMLSEILVILEHLTRHYETPVQVMHDVADARNHLTSARAAFERLERRAWAPEAGDTGN